MDDGCVYSEKACVCVCVRVGKSVILPRSGVMASSGVTALLPPVKSVVVYKNGDPFFSGLPLFSFFFNLLYNG